MLPSWPAIAAADTILVASSWIISSGYTKIANAAKINSQLYLVINVALPAHLEESFDKLNQRIQNLKCDNHLAAAGTSNEKHKF